jgi:hypothetical protein
MHTLLQRLVLTGMLSLAWCLVLFTVYLCYTLEWRGPMRDLWEFVALIEQHFQGQSFQDRWNWQGLLEPYGGIHRLLLPKLLFIADYHLAAGSNYLSLTVSLLLHIGACALLLHSVCAQENFDRQDKRLFVAIVLLFFFSTTQIYNLIYTSDNQVVISNALAVLSAWYFVRQRILLAYGVLIAACLSHSSSLMLLPAFILLNIALQCPLKTILLQIFFSALWLGLYVSGADPLDNPTNTLPLWQQLPTALVGVLMQAEGIVRYIGLHLSSPTSRLWPTAGIVISYLSIAYLFYVVWRVYRKRKSLDRTEMLFLCLALYVFFIAVITACGRQIYPNSALTDRYQTLVMTYWPSLLFLLYRDLKGITSWSFPIISIFSLALLLPHQYNKAVEMAWLSSRVQVAHTAATVGITDMDTVAATLSHPLLMDKKNLVEKHNDFLREYGLGYFSDKHSEYFLAKDSHILLNKPVQQDENCGGELLEQQNISPLNENTATFRLEGRGHIHGKPVANVLVIDALGEVIGLGRDQRAKGEFRPLLFRKPADTRWVGFVRSATPLQYPLSVVAPQGDRYCKLFMVLPEEDGGG